MRSATASTSFCAAARRRPWRREVTSVTTPSQTVGPFFHDGLDRPSWADLATAGASGEKIRVEGHILDGDRAPVCDAFLEICQANPPRPYPPNENLPPTPSDPNSPSFPPPSPAPHPP